MVSVIQMTSDSIPVSIRFPRDTYEWLRKQAYETHTPINAIVREAVGKAMQAATPKGKK